MTGTETGVDMTDERVEKSRGLVPDNGFHTVEFHQGSFEDPPSDD